MEYRIGIEDFPTKTALSKWLLDRLFSEIYEM